MMVPFGRNKYVPLLPSYRLYVLYTMATITKLFSVVASPPPPHFSPTTDCLCYHAHYNLAIFSGHLPPPLPHFYLTTD